VPVNNSVFLIFTPSCSFSAIAISARDFGFTHVIHPSYVMTSTISG
jgi:hypothetical protein